MSRLTVKSHQVAVVLLLRALDWLREESTMEYSSEQVGSSRTWCSWLRCWCSSCRWSRSSAGGLSESLGEVIMLLWHLSSCDRHSLLLVVESGHNQSAGWSLLEWLEIREASLAAVVEQSCLPIELPGCLASCFNDGAVPVDGR